MQRFDRGVVSSSIVQKCIYNLGKRSLQYIIQFMINIKNMCTCAPVTQVIPMKSSQTLRRADAGSVLQGANREYNYYTIQEDKVENLD